MPMAKSSKKSAAQVGAAEKLKKGKRDAEDAVNEKSGKKQKKELVEEKRSVVQIKKKVIKSHASSDEETSTESEQVNKVEVSAKNGAVDSDSYSGDESSGSEEGASVPKSIHSAKNGHVAASRTSNELGDESDSEDEAPKTAVSLKRTFVEAIQSKKGTSSGDDSDDGSEESDNEEQQEKKIKAPGTDEKMTDVAPAKDSGKEASPSEEASKTPVTPKDQTTGSCTLFVGNLSFSVEQADVENFFKNAGEVVDVRLVMNSDNTFRGYGHVQFATAEEAEKALHEMNGKELLGRPLRLELARERGSYTPHSIEKDAHLSKKGGKSQGQTVFVRGFNKNDGEDQIKSALRDHFDSCGEITRLFIPKDQDGAFKGTAYIDFKESDGFNQALKLNGSEIGDDSLVVEAAKPRSGWSGGRGSGDRFGGRSGGRFRGGGRSGGRFRGGGRSGGHFRGGGRRGRGHRAPNG